MGGAEGIKSDDDDDGGVKVEGEGALLPGGGEIAGRVRAPRFAALTALAGPLLPEGFRRVLRHHYAAEDTRAVDAILGRQYHAVVGNPPYITPKDGAMRDAYREIYASCYRTYGLGAPFIERFFDLALVGTERDSAGFVGLIVANSFMKREFGKALLQKWV